MQRGKVEGKGHNLVGTRGNFVGLLVANTKALARRLRSVGWFVAGRVGAKGVELARLWKIYRIEGPPAGIPSRKSGREFWS